MSDDEIAAAILALMEKQKMISEGAGATALAGVMFEKVPELEGKKVRCVLSGRSIDVTILSGIICRGFSCPEGRAPSRFRQGTIPVRQGTSPG